jgi:hypothetical protein
VAAFVIRVCGCGACERIVALLCALLWLLYVLCCYVVVLPLKVGSCGRGEIARRTSISGTTFALRR